MEQRNPYLILGLPYGVERKVAAGAYARALRKVGTGEFPFSREDLNWALHQIEQEIHDPDTHLDYLRVPAVPDAYEPSGDGIVVPSIERIDRSTTSRKLDHLLRGEEAVTQAVRTSLEGIGPSLIPEVSRPDRPSEERHHRPPPRTGEQGRAQPPPPGPWAAASPSGRPDGIAGSPAAVFTRVMARIVDFIIVLVAVGILVGDSVFFSSALAVGVFGYSTLLEGNDGRTVGKRFLQLRVVSTTGQLIDNGRAARRNALWLVGLVPVIGIWLIIGAGVWAAITASSRAQQQGFHDSYAGTVVVDESKT
jgi:uncharacterized RDD family membrane protein YckC